MSFEDFIDEEDVEFVNELKNPKKYHYEEHSDDTIHFYMNGEEIDYEEVVDSLNGQDYRIKELKSIVKDWEKSDIKEKYGYKVIDIDDGDVDD